MLDLAALSISEPASTTYSPTPFGKEMLKHFQFDPAYKNLNHGSFGTHPLAVKKLADHFRNEVERRPDPFIRYAYPQLLDRSRVAIASLLNVPTGTCVFVPNATTGVNTVLRNILWNEDKADEILYFNTIYGACGRTITYVCQSTRLVSSRKITTPYPLSTATYVEIFRAAIAASRAAGKRPRVAIFDIVSTLPGVRVPFEALVAVCKEEEILSLIDGAHGVGHVPLDLSAVDPDFFVSNCHKWLFSPRGCAVLYVPERNQEIIRSTLPTSHGYLPIPTKGDSADEKLPLNPLPPSAKSAFVTNFEFVGTVDNTPYLCVAEAIKWREQVCGGEKAIYEYCRDLARNGAKTVASILGTEVLENEEDNLQDCCMSMVLLPIDLQGKGGDIPAAQELAVSVWLNETLISQYNTFLAISFFQGQFWVRLSAQVYLDLDDFVWAGNVLKDLSQRANKGEFLAAKSEDAPLAGGIEDKVEELVIE